MCFCLVKAETLFFLDALDFRQDLGIRQNIIHQLLREPFRQSFLPPKFVSYGNIPIYLAAT